MHDVGDHAEALSWLKNILSDIAVKVLGDDLESSFQDYEEFLANAVELIPADAPFGHRAIGTDPETTDVGRNEGKLLGIVGEVLLHFCEREFQVYPELGAGFGSPGSIAHTFPKFINSRNLLWKVSATVGAIHIVPFLFLELSSLDITYIYKFVKITDYGYGLTLKILQKGASVEAPL